MLRSSQLTPDQLAAIQDALDDPQNQQEDQIMKSALSAVFIKADALSDISDEDWEGLSGASG